MTTDRRGAPDTFDSAALAQAVARLKRGGSGEVRLPGFDHAKGDPEPNAIVIQDLSDVEVIIWEGLYLFFFDSVCAQLDLGIYIRSDLERCMDALKIRNLVLPGYTKEEILKRVDAVDRANALAVEEQAEGLFEMVRRSGGIAAAQAVGTGEETAAIGTTAAGAAATRPISTVNPMRLLAVDGWTLRSC